MTKNRYHIKALAGPAFFSTLIVMGALSLWGGAYPLKIFHYSSSSGSLQNSVSPDAVRYQNIFKAQQRGDMVQADLLIQKLDDKDLMGHVLYQRYMHPSYKTSFADLKNWMDLYAALPEADKVYALAVRRMPKDYKGVLKKPELAEILPTIATPSVQKLYISSMKRDAGQMARLKIFNQQILDLVSLYKVDDALAALEKKSGSGLVDQVEYDDLQSRIAAAALYSGRVDKAYALAKLSFQRSGQQVPLAGWVSGLAAWKKGDYRAASAYFEGAAGSPYTNETMAAASYYWAARSRLEAGDRGSTDLLKKAAQYPRSFYGLIATSTLGQQFAFNWSVPVLTKENRDVLSAIPAGRRAMRLVAAGQNHLAEAELLHIPANDLAVRGALLAYAADQGLAVLTMRLGSHDTQSASYDATSYPKTSLVPEGGYKIDPALIHAIARQESRFDPNARSAKGATGLMQIMPATANALAGRDGLSLQDPKTNLQLGQLYLQDLLNNKNVGGDLVALLVAYNAGPGNLSRWKKDGAIEDPLLFIETLPSAETRGYVKRVLSNYWMYSLRDDSSVATLNAIAKGQPALYAALSSYDIAAAR